MSPEGAASFIFHLGNEETKMYVELPDKGSPNYAYSLHMQKLLTELDKETDRGAALFSASVLDDLLEKLITAYLVPGKASQALLKGNGGQAPIGTFSARIHTASALGLITDREYSDMHVFRKIRNEFAHSANFDISFNTQKIESLCLSFGGSPAAIKFFGERLKQRGRNLFSMTFILLHYILVERIEQANIDSLRKRV